MSPASRPVILVVDDLRPSYDGLVRELGRHDGGRLLDEFEFAHVGCFDELKRWYGENRDRFVSLVVQDVDFTGLKDERRFITLRSMPAPSERNFDHRALQGFLICGAMRRENIDRTAPVVFVSGRVGVESTTRFAEFLSGPGYAGCTFVPESALGEEYYARIADQIDSMALRPLSEEQQRYWRESHGMVVGRSRRMAHLVREIERIGPGNAIVLILGAPGVGKELVANALHRLSPRCVEGDPHRDLPLTVNMASLNKGLIEDELFGHDRGAYTGASNDRAGIFESARGTTVFLDEIGEIDQVVQAKLLRTIEYHRVKRLGSAYENEVDIRVLASTNRSVSELQRHFRPDFYGRLVQVCIAVPSLAERWAGESAEVIEHDLSQMFEFVIERMNFENRRRRHIGLERSAVRLVRQLVDEHIEGTDNFFDGNVRMLRNIIERAYEGAQYDNSSVVGLGHVMTTLGAARMMQVGAAAAAAAEPLPSLEQVVGTLNFDVIRRRAIDEALARTQGNQIKAAELLGIHRDTLRRWLQGPEEPDHA